MPARERRAETCGRGVERRPHPIGEVLDGDRQDLLADHHGKEERSAPPAPCPQEVEGQDDEREGDDDLPLAEIGDEMKPAGGELRPVVEAPFRGRVVQPLRCWQRTGEVGEQAEQKAGADRDAERESEEQSAGDAPVET